MSSNLFNPSGVDLDTLFELRADFPSLTNTDIGFNTNFLVGSTDIRNRYIRKFDSVTIPAVQMRMDTPYVPPSQGECFYEKESDQWFCIQFPAIPAQQYDLADLFAPKGRIDGYFRYPFVVAPSNRELSASEPVAHNFSGNVTRSASFDVLLPAGVFDTNLSITEIILVSTTGAGTNSFITGVITLAGSNAAYRYRTLRVIVPVTTFIGANDPLATNTATQTITFRSRASNGRYSNTTGTVHPVTNRTATFNCSYTLSLVRQPPGGGDDGGIIF